MDVFVAGGTGFIGRRLCHELAERGHGVTAASRSAADADNPAGVTARAVDVTSGNLAAAVDGHDAVVNLVALPSHRTNRRRSHEAVHLGGTRALLAAAETTDAERFVQVSGLGVDAGIETAYFRAKRRAESLVREAPVDAVVVRPSVVFGEGCAFFAFLRRIVPPVVAPLPGGGRMRLQPIWVGDLAPMLADCVAEARHVDETYEIGGPDRLQLRDIVEGVCGTRYVLPIPMALARVGFTLADPLPFVPVGRDQYRVFRHDNVVEDNDAAAFGREPAHLRSLRNYLDRYE